MGKNIIHMAVSIAILMPSPLLFAQNSKFAYSRYNIDMIVLEDRGGQPIGRYLPKGNDAMAHMNELRLERENKIMLNAQFPVVTKSMSVGRVTKDEASDLKYELASKPMFIIGYDAVSMNWLKANKRLLTENGAIGLVVNVATQAQMDKLQAAVGKEVVMQPTPGDSLAQHLKIKHYPFYMDSKGVLR